MNPVFWLIIEALEIYSFVIIIAVVASWLVAFNVINLYNGFVRSLMRVLSALTEPVFRLVRKVVPPIGGLDLSPLIVLFGVYFLQNFVRWLYVRLPF